MNEKYLKMYFSPEGDGGTAEPPKKEEPKNETAELKAQLATLTAKFEDLLKSKPAPEKDLTQKVQDQREHDKKKNEDEKDLEKALTFNLKSKDFLKDHESILPKSMGDIFKAAEKESYGSQMEKANAIKSAMIQEFFLIQANHEFLTEHQKSTLEDYLKLTKTGKEERASQIFENVFQPTLEIIKRVKKAEEITRAKEGFGNESDPEKAYKDKLYNLGLKKFQGVKQ